MEETILIFQLAIFVLFIVSIWKIFEKANKPGWTCLIPFLNIIVLLRIVGKPWWWLFLLLIPIVNIVFIIWMTNLLSKSFGNDEGFTAGLMLIPVIFYPILGLGKSKYIGAAGSNINQESTL